MRRVETKRSNLIKERAAWRVGVGDGVEGRVAVELAVVDDEQG